MPTGASAKRTEELEAVALWHHVRPRQQPERRMVVGFFGRFVHSDGAWRDDPAADAFLVVDIHDSDIATVEFRSTTTAGRFYLGFQPRDYWEQPDASEPVDSDSEASSFSTWADEVLGVSVTAEEIHPFLAEEGVEEPQDAFVEETVVRLIERLRLPVPDDLRAST